MFTSKFKDNELRVIIDEPVREQLQSKGVNPIEVFRLIESFASNILANKDENLIQMTNEETGASISLAVNWDADTKVTVQVTAVNLANVNPDAPQPRSKVNLGEMAADMAKEAANAQAQPADEQA